MIITPQNSLCLMIDIQEKLLPHIYDNQNLVKNCEILIEGLKLFEIPIIANEQYPKGLGKTKDILANKLSEIKFHTKEVFSCCADKEIRSDLLKYKRNIAIVFGIEAHICVLQTCLDLLAKNISPIVVVDCCGSRKPLDKEIALDRMIQAGVVPTTYESLLFELCKRSDNPLFKQISKLVKNKT